MGWRSHPQVSAVAALLLAATAVLWLATGSFPLIDKWQPANARSLGPVSAGHEFEQVLVAPADGLARVDLHLDSSHPEAAGNIEFELSAVEAQVDAGAPGVTDPLRRVAISPDEVNSFEMHRFVFEPVVDSGGREYLVRITSDGEVAAGLTLRTSDKDVYENGKVYIDGSEEPVDLNFALYHDAGAGGLAGKVEPYRPPLLDQGWFFLACLVTGAGIFGWLLWAVVVGRE